MKKRLDMLEISIVLLFFLSAMPPPPPLASASTSFGASSSEASLLSVNARGESIFIYVELLIYLANGFAFVNSSSSSSNKVVKVGREWHRGAAATTCISIWTTVPNRLPQKKGVNLSLHLGICLFGIVCCWGYLTARLTNTKRPYLRKTELLKWGI